MASMKLTKAGTLFYQKLASYKCEHWGLHVDFLYEKLLLLANNSWLFENFVGVRVFEPQCICE